MKTKFGELKEGKLYLNFAELGEDPQKWNLSGLEEVVRNLKVKELHFPQGIDTNSGTSEGMKRVLPLFLLMGGNHNFRIFTDKSYYERASTYYHYGLRGSFEEGYYWTNPAIKPEDDSSKNQ